MPIIGIPNRLIKWGLASRINWTENSRCLLITCQTQPNMVGRCQGGGVSLRGAGRVWVCRIQYIFHLKNEVQKLEVINKKFSGKTIR